MILQDDCDTGRDLTQPKDVAWKVQTVYMQEVRSEIAEQSA